MRPIVQKALSLSLTALTFAALAALSPVGAQENFDTYARYSEQGSQYFKNGQMSQAIEAFEQAMRYAPESSLPIVYNNLAVGYIQRGAYYLNKAGQNESALSDFRKAYFYLEYAWPEGAERKPLHDKNRTVAKENLTVAYRNAKINPLDRNAHQEMAQRLRLQGKFVEAVVEYTQALELDKNQPNYDTAKAIGDLYTVLNLHDKSKKYYAMAVQSTPVETGKLSDDVLVQLGTSQYQTGEIDKAVASFDKALAINPKNVAALNQLEKIWTDEIKFNNASVLGHANLGSIYQKKGMYDEALRQYNAAEYFAEQDKSTSFEVKKQIRLNLGTLFQEKKNYQQALAAYETVLRVDPNHAQANFYKATLLEETGNLDGAIAAYNKVLTLEPKNKGAQDHLLALIKKHPDSSRQAVGLKEYAARFSNNALIQAQVGEEFHQRKDLESASQFYQQALRLDPNLAGVWANLGAVYQEQGKTEAGLQAFKKAAELEPGNATYKQLAETAQNAIGYKAYEQAVALQQQGKSQEALAYFRQALAVNDSPEMRAAYAISLQNAGQLDAAIGEYQRAIAGDAMNADYQYYLGTAYHQKQDLAKARAAYEKALALKSSHAEARQALASIDQVQFAQDLDKAIEAYEKKNYAGALTLINGVLARNSQDATAHYYKGLILDAQNKKAAAIKSYRDAIAYDANFADAYYALGVALETVSDPVGAKNAFETFVQLSGNKDDDFVRYARERVQALSR